MTIETLLTLGKGWTPEIRLVCQDVCADFGDPPCYDLVGDTAHPNTVNPLVPCGICRDLAAARQEPSA